MSEHRVPAEVKESKRAVTIYYVPIIHSVIGRRLKTDRQREEGLRMLWRMHDALEREILLLERTFTDRELRRLGAAGGPRGEPR